MNRRDLIIIGSTGFLAACAGGKLPELPVAVSVALPPEIKEVIDDATAAIKKVESLGTGISDVVKADIEKVKGYVATLTSGTGDTKAIVSGIVSALGTVATFLPPPYGTIALAIETLLPIIGSAVGMKMAARRPTGMSPQMARSVLRS